MPSVTPKQQRFFGAEVGRAEKGMKTKTGMPIGKLKDFASSVKKTAPGKSTTPVGMKPPLVPPTPPKIPRPKVGAKPPTISGDFNMAVKKPSLTGGY